MGNARGDTSRPVKRLSPSVLSRAYGTCICIVPSDYRVSLFLLIFYPQLLSRFKNPWEELSFHYIGQQGKERIYSTEEDR
jgi:hypothetical protein